MAENEEKIKKPIYKKVWFWILIALVVIVVAGMASGDSSVQTSSNGEVKTTQNQEKFTLLESNGDYDGFAFYVTGTIKNNTDKQYTYVQVTFNLYDADGAQIGTALANINNLESNGTWKFKAIGPTEKPASYKLADITGW